MHIEKNVCANLIGTLLDIPGKMKDGVKSRLDLVELNIRSELTPQVREKNIFLPLACYTLSRAEKLSFCKTLSELKVPEGYSSNIQSLMSLTDLKLYGLKSHDHHTIGTSHLKGMQEDVVVTLCLLEKYFPPSFFTIMVHLVVHLVIEIEFCGPVHLRWMYPFERYMKVLKTYVRNINRPEGCMVENYIVEEAIEFCSEFIAGVSSIGLNSSIIKKNSNVDRALSTSSFIRLSKEQLDQAHLYVIQNVHDVLPYVEQEEIDEIRTEWETFVSRFVSWMILFVVVLHRRVEKCAGILVLDLMHCRCLLLVCHGGQDVLFDMCDYIYKWIYWRIWSSWTYSVEYSCFYMEVYAGILGIIVCIVGELVIRH
ncbi:hypothetical protein IC582_007788 [Cucumis melo]